jgi:hypothetical protein
MKTAPTELPERIREGEAPAEPLAWTGFYRIARWPGRIEVSLNFYPLANE